MSDSFQRLAPAHLYEEHGRLAEKMFTPGGLTQEEDRQLQNVRCALDEIQEAQRIAFVCGEQVAALTAERDRAQSALVVEQKMATDAGAQEFRAMRELAEVKAERDALKVHLARAEHDIASCGRHDDYVHVGECGVSVPATISEATVSDEGRPRSKASP